MNDNHAPPGRRPLWQRLVLNRFFATFAVLFGVTVGWNLWVSTHDGGLVQGRVVDRAGAPIAGATVTLWVFNFTTYVEKSRTESGPDGTFRFTDNPSHAILLSADKPGIGRADRVPVRLYFRSQDVTLSEPLRLAGG